MRLIVATIDALPLETDREKPLLPLLIQQPECGPVEEARESRDVHAFVGAQCHGPVDTGSLPSVDVVEGACQMPPATPDLSLTARALRLSPLPVLRELSLHETDAAVTLHGQLPSYYLKQLAQEAVIPTLAGRALLNRVKVVREEVVT
jgi:hypothetical protein